LQSKRWDRLGIVGQWIAGVICGAGVGIELTLGADVGYVAITVGAVLFAAFTKLRKI